MIKVNLKQLAFQFLLAGMFVPVHSFAQVGGDLQTATFEELKLEKESFWNGADLTGSFTSGSFKFNNSYTPEWGSWEGFSYANLTSNVFESYSDSTHFTNAVGGGYNGSANYVVTNANNWMGMTTMEVVNPSEQGEKLRGFYVTNAACAIKAINEGLAPARKFEKGDWLMLTITEPTTGNKVEYYLADYRSENEADHYALDTWQWVDLRSLGNVKTLEFKVTGSDSSDWGLNTPAYFCMDDFNGKREINVAPEQTVEDGSVIDVAQFFTLDDNDASVTYYLEEVSEGCAADVTFNGTSIEIKGNTDYSFNVTVKAVKKGKIYFTSIPCVGKAKTATFEELTLGKESYWNGADLTGSFISGSFKFYNSFTPEWGSWEGFSYANLTSNVFESYSDSTHFTNAVGGGYNGSANYVVTNASNWMGMTKMEIVNPTEEGETLRGFYVTNAACAIKAINEGLAPARKFEKGDWLMLTITEPTTGNKVEYYLADYRSENEADHYALDTWQWVDLRSLGNVKTLEFKVSGSDSGDWGLNTPAYFCMDDFNGHRIVKKAPMQLVEEGTPLNLDKFFKFDDNEATVTYTVDEVPADCGYEFTVNGSELEIKGYSEIVSKIIVKAVKKGKVYYASVPLMQNGESITATFENQKLAKESYWNGADLTNGFIDGSYKFDNAYNPTYGSWGGFSYSNVTSTEFKGYGDPSHYGNVTGGGYDGSENFAVVNCFGPATIHAVQKYGTGEVIRGFYITNSNCAYESMTNGDSFTHKFEQGDWLMLTIKDIKSDKKVEYYLADFRSENEAEHYILDTWQWVDLRELGKVKGLEFVLSGSDSGDYGLNTPAYFCMDNFNGHRVIAEAPAQTIESGTSVDLAQFFTFDNNDASVVYTVDEVSNNYEGFEFTVDGSNLSVKGEMSGECNVVVKAVKKGKVYFVTFPVTVSTGIEGAETSDNNVTERYTIDGKRVNNSVNGVNIIRTNDGKVKKVLVK